MRQLQVTETVSFAQSFPKLRKNIALKKTSFCMQLGTCLLGKGNQWLPLTVVTAAVMRRLLQLLPGERPAVSEARRRSDTASSTNWIGRKKPYWKGGFPSPRSLARRTTMFVARTWSLEMEALTIWSDTEKSVVHRRRAQSAKTQPSLRSSVSQASVMSQSVTDGELRMAFFLAEHRLPLAASEHLNQLFAKLAGRCPGPRKGRCPLDPRWGRCPHTPIRFLSPKDWQPCNCLYIQQIAWKAIPDDRFLPDTRICKKRFWIDPFYVWFIQQIIRFIFILLSHWGWYYALQRLKLIYGSMWHSWSNYTSL